MRIIYSLKTNLQSDYFAGRNLENNFKFYELSMKLTRQYYPVTLYTDEYGAQRLGDFADEVKLLENDSENYIWSEAKFEAISRESGDFLHVDGDLFINRPFNLPDADVYYDHTEHILYDFYYKDNINNFEKYGVSKVFPEWSTEYTGAFNIGIMGFRTEEIKNLYLDRYYKMKEWFFTEFPKDIDAPLISMTIGEHGLSCLSRALEWDSIPLNEHNDYLHMYSGRKHIGMFVEFVDSYLQNHEFKTYKDNGYNI